jgi:hypothetical protein
MVEEIAGPYASPHLPLVLALNLPWLLMPVRLARRMRKEHPFMGAAPDYRREVSEVGVESGTKYKNVRCGGFIRG